MDEVHEFCLRVLGEPAFARAAAQRARADDGEDRIALLAATVRACRERADPHVRPACETAHAAMLEASVCSRASSHA